MLKFYVIMCGTFISSKFSVLLRSLNAMVQYILGGIGDYASVGF